MRSIPVSILEDVTKKCLHIFVRHNIVTTILVDTDGFRIRMLFRDRSDNKVHQLNKAVPYNEVVLNPPSLLKTIDAMLSNMEGHLTVAAKAREYLNEKPSEKEVAENEKRDKVI